MTEAPPILGGFAKCWSKWQAYRKDNWDNSFKISFSGLVVLSLSTNYNFVFTLQVSPTTQLSKDSLICDLVVLRLP